MNEKVKLHRALTRVLAARIPRDCASDLALLRDYIEDSEPVKHGWWIKHRIDDPKSILYGAVKDTTCSICGKSTPYNTEYCMHCGARMDGDSE